MSATTSADVATTSSNRAILQHVMVFTRLIACMVGFAVIAVPFFDGVVGSIYVYRREEGVLAMLDSVWSHWITLFLFAIALLVSVVMSTRRQRSVWESFWAGLDAAAVAAGCYCAPMCLTSWNLTVSIVSWAVLVAALVYGIVKNVKRHSKNEYLAFACESESWHALLRDWAGGLYWSLGAIAMLLVWSSSLHVYADGINSPKTVGEWTGEEQSAASVVSNGKWDDASDSQKIAALQLIAEAEAERLGVRAIAPKVVAESLDDCNGYYLSNDQCIRISKDVLDGEPYTAVGTVCHESFHHAQNTRVQDPVNAVMSGCDARTIVLWAVNQLVYIDGEDAGGYSDYRCQPIEASAFRYQYAEIQYWCDYFEAQNIV